MVHEITYGEEVYELLQDPGGPCLTIILPTHREGSEKKSDFTLIKKYTEKARRLMVENYGKNISGPVLEKLAEVLENLDLDHNQEGLGLFISQALQRVIRFPFPVESKIMASDSFEVRDVLYKSGLTIPYHVLVLTEKVARLFEGQLADLHEVKDKNFPEKYVDDYIYERSFQSASSAGATYEKSMEKDKSILEEIRTKSFFHHIDQRLQSYLLPATPLFVFGTVEILGFFREITKHKANIMGNVQGSYGAATVSQIAPLAWNQMHQSLLQKHLGYVKEYEESIGQGKGSSGLQTIWNAVREGRGRKLLVEKDYRCPGFVAYDSDALFLHQPSVPHRTLPDVVDDVIEKMIEKNGEVILLENGQLEDYDHMVLITRY
jgi:hypothetical protein